jgi:hypothetical protein
LRRVDNAGLSAVARCYHQSEMADTSFRFKVLQPFKAKRFDADLPLGQTVIAASEGEPETDIKPGEIVSALGEPAREAGAVATFIRTARQVDHLYRVEAERFWASVEMIQPRIE